MINYESDKNFRAAMTHATETPKIWEFEGDWYMGNDDGPPLCLNSKRAAEYLADIEIRLAAAEQELGDILAIIHGDGGHYRAEHGNKKATADAIEKLYTLKVSADAAESALQSAWGEAREAAAIPSRIVYAIVHPDGQIMLPTISIDEQVAWNCMANKDKSLGDGYRCMTVSIRALPSPSKAAPEPVNPDYEATARAKPHLYGEPINAAPQEVGTDGITPHDPGPLEVTDVESIVPAGAAPLAEQREDVSLDSIEQYRMQMAGISTAAMGYWKEGDDIHPDYDTIALRDVAKLYAKYADLYAKQSTPAVQLRADGATDKAEAAYWDFDARRKGYSIHASCPQSERDAFKAVVAKFKAPASPAAAKEWAYDENCWSGNTKVGDEVVFMAKNGWPGEAERASNDLTKDEKYIVTDVIDHGDSTDIYLAGFDRPFNSVMFRHAHPPTGDRHE